MFYLKCPTKEETSRVEPSKKISKTLLSTLVKLKATTTLFSKGVILKLMLTHFTNKLKL